MSRRPIVGALALTALAATLACSKADRPRKGASALRRDAATRALIAAADRGAGAASASTSASAPIAAPAPIAVGGDACRITRGPIQLPFTGQALFWPDDRDPDRDPRIVFNHAGVPRAVGLPAPPKPKDAKAAEAQKPERLALSEPAEVATAPGCAAAGALVFCMDPSGGIHKSAAPGQAGPEIAKARAGTPLAAAPLGAHLLYAFLADRRTSEGTTTMAFAGVDEEAPVLLSEDGAGATFVTLAPRGDEVVGMYIDARRVLTPVHARVLSFAGKLALGPDAVLFVGAGGEARPFGALAQGAAGPGLALLAVDRDGRQFGMAAIRVDLRPKDDAPVTWSTYPAALGGAPLAVTGGGFPARVLRVRPASAEPSAKKVLELGEIDAAGAYKASCGVAEGEAFGDLAITIDRKGALWIAYTDESGTWVEKRGR